MAMLAPSWAARSAMAWPMPRLAPVTNRVLPFSDMGSLLADAGTSGRGAVPVDAVLVPLAHGLAAGDQAVQMGEALAGRHAQQAGIDLPAEQHVEDVHRPLGLGDQ